jgi:hypothetical protein
MNGGMEQAQRLTQVRGVTAVGLISVLSFSFPSFRCYSIIQVSFVSGDEG